MLDTDVASYIIKRKHEDAGQRLAGLPPETICISVVTRAELLYGLKRLASDHRLHIGVRRFLTLVPTLPWIDEAADHYADIRHRLVLAGTPIGEMDMMIAAHSLAADAVLVTNNVRHFGRVSPPVQLRDWSSTTTLEGERPHSTLPARDQDR